MERNSLKTRTDIAEELNISQKKLYRLIKKHKIRVPRDHYLSPKHYLPIYEVLGIENEQ